MSDTKMVVDPQLQIASLYKIGELYKQYKVSTAKLGLGCVPESNQTPYGKLKISAKFGDEAPIGAVFRSREQTGEICNSDPDNPLNHGDDLKRNFVLTRILWLSGTEDVNKETIKRYIYLHGTRFEDKVGKPNSAGCICFTNSDIIDVYDNMNVGDEVEVLNQEYNEELAKKVQMNIRG